MLLVHKISQVFTSVLENLSENLVLKHDLKSPLFQKKLFSLDF
jgi:hypothetical protein